MMASIKFYAYKFTVYLYTCQLLKNAGESVETDGKAELIIEE